MPCKIILVLTSNFTRHIVNTLRFVVRIVKNAFWKMGPMLKSICVAILHHIRNVAHFVVFVHENRVCLL